MKKQDFYFDLPAHLIAQYPLANRRDSRLLAYSRANEEIQHQKFNQIIDYLQPGDLLVLNDTRVMPARLYGQKESGGKVEFLVERIMDDSNFIAHIKASKAPKADSCIIINSKWRVTVVAKLDDLYHCRTDGLVDDLLNEVGTIPLPLYITRPSEDADKERYQTVYARHKGSVAAPTAGLHFDETMLNALRAKGIEIGYVTLHVGAGTFRPVRCDSIVDHKMHREFCQVDEVLCSQVQQTKQLGGRVIAVGTTAMRSLETAAASGKLAPFANETSIFIYPGYQFKLCDGLLTNFHLPESTLLMLVAAFIGHAQVMHLYKSAIENEYRFFSYGDACLFL